MESERGPYSKDEAYLFLAKSILVIAAPSKGLCTPLIPQGGLNSSNLGKKFEIGVSLSTTSVNDS